MIGTYRASLTSRLCWTTDANNADLKMSKKLKKHTHMYIHINIENDDDYYVDDDKYNDIKLKISRQPMLIKLTSKYLKNNENIDNNDNNTKLILNYLKNDNNNCDKKSIKVIQKHLQNKNNDDDRDIFIHLHSNTYIYIGDLQISEKSK